MTSFASTAILLKRINFGDYDQIITFYTLARGKMSIIAKYARKSTKRFAGILEPFSAMEIICSSGKGNRLPVLQEATLKEPFPGIRTNIYKTAYASLWIELIDKWVEDGEQHTELFNLLWHVLEKLNKDTIPKETISILFQIKFMILAGMGPNLSCCTTCKTKTDDIKQNRIYFDLDKGGLICAGCSQEGIQKRRILLTKGTVKQLLWVGNNELPIAQKIKFSTNATKESLFFLETFVPYHIKKMPKSLDFLRQIRRSI